MKTAPETIFRTLVGITVVIHEPAAIAMPSTIKKASITPSKSCKCFFVFEDNNRIDICVLSPSSAAAIATNGMSISSIMFVTLGK